MARALETAIDAWDKRWATAEGRADWLDPEPDVIALLPELKERGARTALDLGCGVGRHALFLAEHGLAVEAIDGSAAGLAVARETAQARGVSLGLRQGTADALPFDDGSFDFVLSWNVIYHGTSGRCRAAPRRDLARAEARRALPGHDAADPQHQLRQRPHRRPGHLCRRWGRGTRAPAFLLRCRHPRCAVRRLRAAFSQAATAAQARFLALAHHRRAPVTAARIGDMAHENWPVLPDPGAQTLDPGQ